MRNLLGKEILFFDGGMGTLLQERGLQAGKVRETAESVWLRKQLLK